MVHPTPQERRARQRRETRHALLDAAVGAYLEAGYAATSVDAVAARAGYTSGAVYDHFGNKEGILVAMVERFLNDPLPTWGEATSAAESFISKLHAYGRVAASVDISPNFEALVHEIYACVLRHPELRDRVGAMFEDRFREAGAGIPLEGTLSGTDVVVLVQALLDGLRLRAVLNPELVRPELYEAALALLAGIEGLADLAEQAPGDRG
jgi:AcrR family transcriptional regulator